MDKKSVLEKRIAKLEKMLHMKNESTGSCAVALHEAVGCGDLRWKDIAETFLDLADEDLCQLVCDELGV